MLPLFLVYLSEYTINLGLFPVLLFPLPSTPFTTPRSFYPTYTLLYQLGVFLSRSSLPLFRLRRLYPPSLLQVVNLFFLLFIAIAEFSWVDDVGVWVVMGVVFWEGLLGGAVYVNTFAAVGEGRVGGGWEGKGMEGEGMEGLGLEGEETEGEGRKGEGREGKEREWSLGAVTVSDSAGICVAGFVAMGVERGVCAWQVGRGRDWCRKL